MIQIFLSFHQKHISQAGRFAVNWEAYHKMGVVFDNQGMHDEANKTRRNLMEEGRPNGVGPSLELARGPFEKHV